MRVNIYNNVLLSLALVPRMLMRLACNCPRKVHTTTFLPLDQVMSAVVSELRLKERCFHLLHCQHWRYTSTQKHSSQQWLYRCTQKHSTVNTGSTHAHRHSTAEHVKAMNINILWAATHEPTMCSVIFVLFCRLINIFVITPLLLCHSLCLLSHHYYHVTHCVL